MTQVIMVCGDDLHEMERRAVVCLGDEPWESMDVGDEEDVHELLSLFSMTPLFGGDTHLKVSGLESLHATKVVKALNALKENGNTSVAVVVWHGSPAASIRAALEGCRVEECSWPKPRDLYNWTKERCRSLKLQVSEEVIRGLVDAGGTHPERVAGVLESMASSNMKRISLSDAMSLLGALSDEGTPWGITDALEKGNLMEALTQARGCEAVPAIYYMLGQVVLAGTLLDLEATNGKVDNPTAAKALGMAQAWQVDKVRKLGARLGSDGAIAALRVLVQADLWVKSGRRHVLDEVVVALSQVMK